MRFLDTVQQDILAHVVFWSSCIAFIVVMRRVRPHAQHTRSQSASLPTIIVTQDVDAEKGLVIGDQTTTLHADQPALPLSIKLWRGAAFTWALAVTFVSLMTITSSPSQMGRALKGSEFTVLDMFSFAKFSVIHQIIYIASVSVWGTSLAVSCRSPNKPLCPKQYGPDKSCESTSRLMFAAIFLPLLSAVTPTTLEGLPVYVLNGVVVPIQIVYVLQSIVSAVFTAKSCAWQHQPVPVHAEDAKCWNCYTHSERCGVMKAKLGELFCIRRRQAIRLDGATEESMVERS
ncbi:hypothetical protein EXIGLDRAFT_780470 [Exidia glandulosa HHB12029]|uniref:Uncharacterized protein n=1 Tax=Exidia glandulosa HHB12029 TaxID=1314781 RepID=A0A165BLD8_EXIGL|nr:hypothetical protein EXIGLDRAFT_780470 [Exidia glandulosa HHB12029]